MNPYDPFAFGQPPEDAISDPEAMLDLALSPQGYAPQAEMPLFEENSDLPPSEVDPRGMLKAGYGGADPMGAMPQDPMAMGGEQLDEEALQQAILDEGMRDNEMSEQYQAGIVEQNEEEERRLAKANNGGM